MFKNSKEIKDIKAFLYTSGIAHSPNMLNTSHAFDEVIGLPYEVKALGNMVQRLESKVRHCEAILERPKKEWGIALDSTPRNHKDKRWTDLLSPNTPMLCYVRDEIAYPWNEIPKFIEAWVPAQNDLYPFRTVNGNVYRYAKRVPREMLRQMLEDYDLGWE